MPWPRLKMSIVVLAVEAVVLLLDGILHGRWRWLIIFAVLAACVAVDWLLIRRRSDAGWEVKDRLRLAAMALALGMAFPTIHRLWMWLP